MKAEHPLDLPLFAHQESSCGKTLGLAQEKRPAINGALSSLFRLSTYYCTVTVNVGLVVVPPDAPSIVMV